MSDDHLRMTRHFAAPPERVFAAWTDPNYVREWLFTSPGGTNDLRLDPTVGGKWRIADIRDGVTYVASGQYTEVDRPHRLAFTFAMLQFSPNADTITIDIAADGVGSLMTFTQSGTDIAKELDQTPGGETGGSEQGWSLMFDTLRGLVEQG